MARKAGGRNRNFWYWTQRSVWVHSTSQDKRIPLVDEHGERIRDPSAEKLAEQSYWRMFHRGDFRQYEAYSAGSVDAIADAYVASIEDGKSRDNASKVLMRFRLDFGSRQAEQVTQEEVARYLNKPEWNGTTRQSVRKWIRAMFAHAGIKVNPCDGIRLPKSQSRTFIFTPEQEQAIYEHSHPAFAFYMKVLFHTGARPAEISRLTPSHIKTDGHRVIAVLKPEEWKNGRKSKQERIILFPNGETGIADEVKRLASNRPDDAPLFSNCRGGRWNDCSSSQQLTRLKKLGLLPDEAVVYSARHTFITRAVASTDIPLARLAKMVGTSARKIEQHYSHLRTEDLFADLDTITSIM